MPINKLKYYLFFSLIIIASLQFTSWGISGKLYNILRGIIIAFAVLIFLISVKDINKKILRLKVFQTHLIGIILLIIILLILQILGFDVLYNPVRDLTLAIVLLIIGFTLSLKENQYRKLINTYIFLFTLAALSIVYTYSSGFVIQDFYFPIPKNQIAPAFGTAFILALYFSFKSKGFKKLSYLVLGFLLLGSLLVIRGRAAIIAVFLTMIIFIFIYIRSRKYKILTILVVIALLPFIGQFIFEALFLNFDTSDINSISTGRVESYLEGLEFLKKHWFGGLLESASYKGDTIHNYILYNVVNYGIFISFVLIVVYFKYVFKIFSSIRKNTFQYYEVGPLVMVIIFVVSLFEYTYPYAPGSAIFFPFFLMGQYLKLNSQQIQHNK